MENKEKIIEVKDLVISFKTDHGILHAVRDVSFDLYKGETLCIVGESGSGKSVTSKAIMGILAANAIVEQGNILYRGEDLLQVAEEEFHKIRGHKIGMIFQDPLSSLNPIVRIGKQITEATLINSNKLKLLYDDLISDDLIAYKNTLVRGDIKIKAVKSEYDKELAEAKHDASLDVLNDLEREEYDNLRKQSQALKSEELTLEKKLNAKANKADKESEAKESTLSLEEINARLKEIKAISEENSAKIANFNEIIAERRTNQKAEYKKRVAEIKAKKPAMKEQIKAIKEETNKLSAPLKVKLDATKKEAKVRVAQYKTGVLRTYQEELDALNAKGLDKKSEEYKSELAAINKKKIDNLKITKAEAKRRALEIMREVGIPEPEKRFKQYPFEFSGGMRQRIVIAIALTETPEVLICDEPTTALDVTIQGQILELIKKIQEERNLSVIFITHDLGVVANMADRVAVMYAGKIVEYGTSEEIFFEPKHPYTWALLSSIPDVDSKERLEAIPGTPPNMIYPPKGDAFAARSRYAMKIDFEQEPPMFKISDTHYAATWLLHPKAPKVEMPKIVSERINNSLKARKEAK